MTPRLQTKERLIQKSFYSLKLQWLYTALTFNDKFLHRPENDQRTPNLSEKLTILAQNLPHLEFFFIFNTAIFPEKSQKHRADIPELHMWRDPNAHPALTALTEL